MTRADRDATPVEQALLRHVALYYGRASPLPYVSDYLRDCAKELAAIYWPKPKKKQRKRKTT